MTSAFNTQVKSNLASMGKSDLLPRLQAKGGIAGTWATQALAAPDPAAAAGAVTAPTTGDLDRPAERKPRKSRTTTGGTVTPLGATQRSSIGAARKELLG